MARLQNMQEAQAQQQVQPHMMSEDELMIL